MTRPTLKNISVIQLNESFTLTRPSEFEPLTRQTQFDTLTQPTEFEPLKQPTGFEPLTRPTEFPEQNEKMTYQMTRTQNHHRQTHHQRKRKATRRKSVVNTGDMTRQTHNQPTILILQMTVITDTSYVRGK